MAVNASNELFSVEIMFADNKVAYLEKLDVQIKVILKVP